MQHRFVLTLTCLSLLCCSCDGGEPTANNQGRDDHCDDGTSPICDMSEPRCDAGLILAWQDACYVCVDPGTCLPPVADTCDVDADCGLDQYCDHCGASSCPGCTDCLRACSENPCATGLEPACLSIRPECGPGFTAVVDGTCWRCASLDDCAMWLDDFCNDGTEVLCNMVAPDCSDDELLAVQDGCYVCVNGASCRPWSEPGCTTDADCTIFERCHPCVTSSCPECDDCVAACILADCVEETTLYCDQPRPVCELEDHYAVIRDGCWECITPLACGDL